MNERVIPVDLDSAQLQGHHRRAQPWCGCASAGAAQAGLAVRHRACVLRCLRPGDVLQQQVEPSLLHLNHQQSSLPHKSLRRHSGSSDSLVDQNPKNIRR